VTLLKCVHDVSGSLVSQPGGSVPIPYPCPFEVGEVYDVAEIYEYPYHIMARKNGDWSWPHPGDPMFSWHPEDVFEPTAEPIEIVRCGYTPLDVPSEGVGVVVADPEHVARLVELVDFDVEYDPHKTVRYKEWRSKLTTELSDDVLRAWYQIQSVDELCPDVIEHLGIQASEDVPSRFASVELNYSNLVEHGILKVVAKRIIIEFLAKLGVSCTEPDCWILAYWAGDGTVESIFLDKL